MKTTQRRAPIGRICLVTVLALGASLSGSLAQQRDTGAGRAGAGVSAAERNKLMEGADSERLKAPNPTTRGVFEGTWARVAPGERHAVVLRTDDEGAWELRLYWRTPDGFAIDTQWKTRVDYVYKGFPGWLELEVDQERSDEHRVVARYLRVATGTRDSRLEESGEVVIYRADTQGRTLTWLQEPITQRLFVGEALYPSEAEREMVDRRIWIFSKQAERELAFDDVYW